MTEASAPGKIILCGEHAVVYGRPAIALPLADVRAYAIVRPGAAGSGISIDAPDLERRWTLADTPDHPLSELIGNVLMRLGIANTPDMLIEIGSTIPIAGGMGSGAAVATAIARALAAHLGHNLAAEEVSALVYTSEQHFHGTPSGIDNTVIAYEQPIWFARPTTNDQRPTPALSAVEGTSDRKSGATSQKPKKRPTALYSGPSVAAVSGTSAAAPVAAAIEPIAIAAPFTLLVGDTGVRSPTRLPIGHVRERWRAHPARYEALFDAVGARVTQARAALAAGDLPALGALLDENHSLLKQIGVSSAKLNRLVAAARAAGALGAKLSGAGWGGVMIALVEPAASRLVEQALQNAGAVRVLKTTIADHAITSMQ